jgi:hypothetical protein
MSVNSADNSAKSDGITDLLVAPCSAKAARFAVEHWHYSRSMPMPPIVSYGAWEQGRFIGAVIFARGANRNLYTPYGLDHVEGAELVRVALTEHVSPVSQIVAAAVRRLRASSPGLRLLVSFADPLHGHHGGIYQAMGWVYVGRTSPTRAYRDDRGKVYHQRAVSTSGVVTQFGKRTRTPSRARLEAVSLPGKHRYLLPLDRPTRKRLGHLAQPYPRSQGVDGDAPTVLVGGAGSTPADCSTRETTHAPG